MRHSIQIAAADLDAAFPERPVWLERIDGHAGWANTAAMRRVGRDLGGDWEPDGGQILRDGTKLAGVFVDKAADLALYGRFADEGRLTLRVVAYADGDSTALAERCLKGPYRHRSGRVRMAGVKFYADGALGSRGAALHEPYSGDHGNRGLLVTPPEELLAGMRKARRCNLQVATHAIGDRFGIGRMAAMTAGICLLGALLTAATPDFYLMATGRLLYGIGAETFSIATLAAVAMWGSRRATRRSRWASRSRWAAWAP